MEQAGEHRIAAPRDRVWAALNDPAVLKRCIEGCEALERTGPETLTARVRARVGPVSAVFSGDIALKDLDPPNGYTLEVSAKGGAAGFAKGQARVKLAEDGAATVLAYTAEGSVGGKLAQVGQRLIDAAARKTADDFFNAFARELEEPATPDAAAAGEPGGAATPVPVPTGDVPAAQAATRGGALVWGGLAAVLVIAALVAWWLTAR
ncbi:MAG TPA: carbon monoxide dehydrogenase subunit G [Caulobacteraceae bacterium]|nr:carbon monoxide dehydrogenase subunit G [Caulobacteraceae bacterium]